MKLANLLALDTAIGALAQQQADALFHRYFVATFFNDKTALNIIGHYLNGKITAFEALRMTRKLDKKYSKKWAVTNG